MLNPLQYDQLPITGHQIFFNESISNMSNVKANAVVLDPADIETVDGDCKNMQIRVLAGV